MKTLIESIHDLVDKFNTPDIRISNEEFSLHCEISLGILDVETLVNKVRNFEIDWNWHKFDTA